LIGDFDRASDDDDSTATDVSPPLNIPSTLNLSTLEIDWGKNDGLSWDTVGMSGAFQLLPYASKMRMSEFYREKKLFDWSDLRQIVAAKLSRRSPAACSPSQRTQSLRFLHELWRGPSSTIYAAAYILGVFRDTLALKVLESASTTPGDHPPEEVEIMKDLRHNHIVAFIGYFPLDRGQKHGVLMYPLAPCNLGQYLEIASARIESSGALDISTTKILLTGLGCLTSAVLYLHSLKKAVRHKDIKPQNILVDIHGSLLIADFGISNKYGEVHTTGPGGTPFTAKYAPPEVISKAKRNMSADIFSLGCVFLEIATVALGVDLEELRSYMFDDAVNASLASEKVYSARLPRVHKWMSDLKKRKSQNSADISYSCGRTHIFYANGSHYSPSYSPTNRVTELVPSLEDTHLDMIRSMMSEHPKERPSIRNVHASFNTFARACTECHPEVCLIPLSVADIQLLPVFRRVHPVYL
jgi:serine/threonine protein kinase